MSDFCPDGYVRSQDAIVRAAKSWFPDKIAALESATAPESQTKPDNNFDAVVRALSQPPIPDAWRHAFEDIAGHTVYRLRNFLHEGKLKAYYFGDDGCHSLSREIWATAQADGVMKSGIYWPFGKPTRWHKSRPNYSLFLLQSELEALLTEQPAKKPAASRTRKSRSSWQLCANLTIFRTARPSSKHYATCQNFVSSRSPDTLRAAAKGGAAGGWAKIAAKIVISALLDRLEEQRHPHGGGRGRQPLRPVIWSRKNWGCPADQARRRRKLSARDLVADNRLDFGAAWSVPFQTGRSALFNSSPGVTSGFCATCGSPR